MLHKIDWLSFTKWVKKSEEVMYGHDLRQLLITYIPAWTNIDPTTARPAAKRKGFRLGLTNDQNTMSVWISLDGLLLIEITGGGCTELEAKGLLNGILQDNIDRITRLDIATDILTEVTPTEFVSQRGKSPITSVGLFTSKTGETCYVGSRSSDRCCKVYRYYAPHPRSQFLRIEYTYRTKSAVFAAKHMMEHGLAQTCYASAARYKWEHPCWQPEEANEEELKAWRPERGEAKTVNWLRTQVLAAVKRLDSQGVMSVQEYCEFLLASIPA